ncbi:hypothetical protein T484DRAFT_1933651 [Baffinella frigidus]|nr:hypothetical protein T484DRAFT_1933651 [Cryptophyta sp. CCMP2293]
MLGSVAESSRPKALSGADSPVLLHDFQEGLVVLDEGRSVSCRELGTRAGRTLVRHFRAGVRLSWVPGTWNSPEAFSRTVFPCFWFAG